MYRDRLVHTPVQSDGGRRLQQHLLAYHDFRLRRRHHPLVDRLALLEQWQARRLRESHQDLIADPGYRTGLEFLLSDLYAPSGMTRRDDNIDRVFPKMVKWLPEQQLDTLAGLVELNLVTQSLDLALVETLAYHGHGRRFLTPEQYCQGYRACGQLDQRRRQIELVSEVGQQLDRYVRNRTLGWLLAISRGPADMAGLSDLHAFLQRGYRAFRTMDRVERLIDQLVVRETRVMERIVSGHPAPFTISGTTGEAP
ncbi:FFLEELY motif protein [Marinobacter xestospongiae]|uniref:DUF8198 domain-containing protein n=1 Tax=Marinobacter xestospongiae TaxID=994319 RepID=A0ABU3W3R5_9GAMM|nr:hypothetical protein [Marinobacter xestospongiae]MDV2081061.1 hypothetical protein [Marinobacter xestospongiae]